MHSHYIYESIHHGHSRFIDMSLKTLYKKCTPPSFNMKPPIMYFHHRVSPKMQLTTKLFLFTLGAFCRSFDYTTMYSVSQKNATLYIKKKSNKLALAFSPTPYCPLTKTLDVFICHNNWNILRDRCKEENRRKQTPSVAQCEDNGGTFYEIYLCTKGRHL